MGVRRGRNSNSLIDIHGAFTVCHAGARRVFLCTAPLKSCMLGRSLSLCQIRSQRLCLNYLLIPPKIFMHSLCVRHSARCGVILRKKKIDTIFAFIELSVRGEVGGGRVCFSPCYLHQHPRSFLYSLHSFQPYIKY